MADATELDALKPRTINAGNRGPFTLDGTRTFLVGGGQVAVIDPGPDVEHHVRALVSSVAEAVQVRILLTHHHSDHAGGAEALTRALDAPLFGPPPYGGPADVHALEDGEEIPTDQGSLFAVDTPGHTRHHLAFHWPGGRAVFVGDLLLGRGSTTWLGEYDGCVADFLDSLDRVEALNPRVLYPSHGEPIHDVAGTIGSFRRHRMKRLEQLGKALEAHPEGDSEDLLRAVYGRRLPERVRRAAEASIRVMLHHLRRS